MLDTNITEYFEFVFEEFEKERVSIIHQHLTSIKLSLKKRFSLWKTFPLIWASLNCKDSAFAKKIANKILISISDPKFIETIEWLPLQNLLRQSKTIQELGKFATTR
jgi:hypothetical protein